MSGRCFDITGNKWKERQELVDSDVAISWAGFIGYTRILRKHGWEFVIEKNLFTKNSKLIMRNSALHLIGSGDYNADLTIIRTMLPEKVKGKPRLQMPQEIINFNKLEVVDVLNAILETQQKDAPKKKNPRIINMDKYVNNRNVKAEEKCDVAH